jgi:predicted transcriptional regulator
MLGCMRTTVRLNDDLLAAAKQRAAANHTTLTSLIEDSLRRTLASRPARRDERLEIDRFGDAGTLVGVDLDDSESLRDLMDGLR